MGEKVRSAENRSMFCEETYSMEELALAIENYKQTRGYYPPSSADRNRAGTNSLYYELTGAVYTPDPQGKVRQPSNRRR